MSSIDPLIERAQELQRTVAALVAGHLRDADGLPGGTEVTVARLDGTTILTFPDGFVFAVYTALQNLPPGHEPGTCGPECLCGQTRPS